MLKKKKENIYPQATPCDANFITSVSFIYKLPFNFHKFGESKNLPQSSKILACVPPTKDNCCSTYIEK